MAGLKELSSVWNNIKEVDLKPIREAAMIPVRITLAGAVGSGRHTPAEQMRTDPAREGIHTQSPITLMTVDATSPTPSADLIILMVDATQADTSVEQALAEKWGEAGRNVLIFINKIDLVNGIIPNESGQGWMATHVLFGSANSSSFLQKEFVPAVLEQLPLHHIALGRQFPLFRLTIAHQLINETCFSNAAYSFSTGLAEIVPVLDLPLNLTDLVVLTKSQAFLAYKLGLLVGFSTRWQDYVTEFGGVIGGGFVWRQAARSLVGLVPGWGIIPKVAIAYSGTYVVGQAILGWYLSGRHLTSKELRELSVKAFSRGKEYARKLVDRLPKRRIGARNKEIPQTLSKITRELPGSTSNQIEVVIIDGNTGVEGTSALNYHETGEAQKTVQKRQVRLPRIILADRVRRHHHEKTTLVEDALLCAQCGKASSMEALFCQYCGHPFEG